MLKAIIQFIIITIVLQSSANAQDFEDAQYDFLDEVYISNKKTPLYSSYKDDKRIIAYLAEGCFLDSRMFNGEAPKWAADWHFITAYSCPQIDKEIKRIYIDGYVNIKDTYTISTPIFEVNTNVNFKIDKKFSIKACNDESCNTILTLNDIDLNINCYFEFLSEINNKIISSDWRQIKADYCTYKGGVKYKTYSGFYFHKRFLKSADK